MDRALPSLAITLAHSLDRDGTPVHGITVGETHTRVRGRKLSPSYAKYLNTTLVISFPMPCT